MTAHKSANEKVVEVIYRKNRTVYVLGCGHRVAVEASRSAKVPEYYNRCPWCLYARRTKKLQREAGEAA